MRIKINYLVFFVDILDENYGYGYKGLSMLTPNDFKLKYYNKYMKFNVPRNMEDIKILKC